MTQINFRVTFEELRLLANLTSDQLFRRQYIDPKMPGHKGNPEELDLGKALLGRMRQIIHQSDPHSTSALAQRPPSRKQEVL